MIRFSNVQIARGVRLHCAEQGDAAGRPVLFLHGWPDSWFSFTRVTELLPSWCRAWMIDQRGFGDSDRPEEGYEIVDLAADAIAFLDAMSVDRATIVGHSFGSFVARRMAMLDAGRVERLILVGTGWLGANDVTREVHESLRGLPNPVPREFARDFQASTAYAPLPSDFFERIVDESLKLPAKLWPELLGAVIRNDDVAELATMTAPTLLLWGAHDALFPRGDQDRLLQTIPNARLRIYPEIGHCPNWECPGLVASDLVDFMSQS